MPRKPKGPRLHLRPPRADRAAVWVILDRGKETSTGCSEGDIAGAESALAAYITDKYTPPNTKGKLAKTNIADVIAVYIKERGPKTADKGEWVSYMCAPLLEFWGMNTLADVRASRCHEYVDWRVAQKVSDQTARHELTNLRAAINYYHKNYGPLDAIPDVTLPPRASVRMDYWLTRKQVADRLRAARRLPLCGHIVRVLLIGVYSGTRPGAARGLHWIPSTVGGWVDLESETIHRRPIVRSGHRTVGDADNKKRQPPVRIHARLLPWLRRWQKQDMAQGITRVVHYYGKHIGKLRRSWKSVAIEAGHARKGIKNGKTVWIVDDGPHICRHTAATWQMQAGTDPYEAAGYLGMSEKTLSEVYGHHHPDHQSSAARADGRKRRHAHDTPKKRMNEDGTNHQ